MVNYCINSAHRPVDFENLVNKQHTTEPGTKFFRQTLPFEPRKAPISGGVAGREGLQMDKSVIFHSY